MNRQIVAVILQEGGKFITELIKTRSFKRVTVTGPQTVMVGEQQDITEADKASSIEAGCVPCAIGHLGTCSGLLNEAMRFAKKEGIASSEVINRVNICMDELNALERVDLRSELTLNLPPWEKELADKALVASRSTRHGLEGLTGVADLEKITAITQSTRQEIGRAWFKERLARMSPEEKRNITEKAIEKLEKEE